MPTVKDVQWRAPSAVRSDHQLLNNTEDREPVVTVNLISNKEGKQKLSIIDGKCPVPQTEGEVEGSQRKVM